MNIIRLQNVKLNDNNIMFANQDILRIELSNKTIDIDLIDNRINSYEVVVSNETQITTIMQNEI